MQDLYKGFRKVAEDEGSATLKHENGHELNIAKSGLSKKHKIALEKLPLHQADGTQESADQQLSETDKLKQWSNQQSESLQDVGREIKQAVAQDIVAGATENQPANFRQQLELAHPNQTTPEFSAHSYAPKDQLQTQSVLIPQEVPQVEQYAPQAEQQLAEPQTTEPEIKQAEAPSAVDTQTLPPPTPSIQAPGKTLMAEAVKVMTPEEIISSPNTNVMQKINAHNQMYLDSIKRKAAADDEFQQQMRDKKIDPNRVYHDMSTGRKIRTIIGMLLGGMSAGILRTENPLLKMLNEEIERDVNLQKQDKTDAINLFKVHYERLGDEGAAHQQAANNLRAAALMEMEIALGKLDPNSQMGRLAIQSAADTLRLQSQQARAGMAALEQRKKVMSMLNSGQMQNVDPAELVNILITDDGAKAKALEEIKDAQNLSANANKIINNFEKAAKDRGFYRSAKSVVTREMPESVAVFEQSLDPFFKDIAGQNREATKRATFDRLTPGPWDSEADVLRKKEALINFMRATKAAPVSKSYGLDLDKFATTSWTDPSIERENQFIQYAKQNAKNPDPKVQQRVQFIQRKYGVK